MRTRRERIRLALLKALAFVTFPPDLSRLTGSARILLVRPDHLGDVLFTTPALRLLREALPEAHITYLVGPWSREVVENNPNVDEVLSCEFPGFTRQPKRLPVAPYFYLRRQAKKLKAGQFDVAINLRFDFWWGAMLTYFADIPHRIGYTTPETKPFLTLALPHMPGRHEVLQNLRLAEAVARLTGSAPFGSIDSQLGTELEFHTREEDERFAESWLAAISAAGPVALIHPGTGSPVKLWNAEGFAEVADAIAERFGLRIIISGSKSEEALVQSVKQRMRHEPAILMGASLAQLASIIRRCRLALGVDSGIMHLASAVGTPTIRLYGPVDDATFGPWGEPAIQIVVKSDLDCIPCNRLDYNPKEAAAHLCVKSIDPSRVLGAVEQILGSGKS